MQTIYDRHKKEVARYILFSFFIVYTFFTFIQLSYHSSLHIPLCIFLHLRTFKTPPSGAAVMTKMMPNGLKYLV
jgi:hypothetical protein